MRLPTSLTITALAGAILAAAPAQAAWLPSQVLDTGGSAAMSPLLSPARGGAATVLFKDDRAVAARATVGADLSTTAFRSLSAPYTTAAADAGGRALLAHMKIKGSTLRVRTVSPSGEVGPRVKIGTDLPVVSLAVNRAGAAMLAARSDDGRVFAAMGSTRSGFGPLQQLSGGGRTVGVDTAINARGDAAVAFQRRGRLHVADRVASAARFGEVREVGPSAMAESPELEVALGERGAALVAYTDGRRFLAAARERRGAFGEPQVLAEGLEGTGLRPGAAVVGDTASLAYVSVNRTVELAQGPAGGRLAEPEQLSTEGATAGGVELAAGAAGELAVLFVEDGVARAAVQPADGTIGAAEPIDTGERTVIDVAAVATGGGRFIAAIETGLPPKRSRDIRVSAFAP